MPALIRSALVALLCLAITLGVAWVVGGAAVAVGPFAATVVAVFTAFLVNWVAFVPAAIGRTERFYDAVGALTYLTIIGLALISVLLAGGSLGALALITAAMVACWAIRLGSFLLRRVRRAGRDGRFDEIKTNPPRFFVAWTLQGMWVSFTALAALVLITDERSPAIGPVAVIGWLIWVAGFALEVVADRQKSAFRADPANRDRFISTGLWSRSRHPNYFGEITLWTGIFVSGMGSYSGGQWLAVLSPVFVTVLLMRASGVPLLEARADAKWGEDADYLAYKSRTPVLVPRLGAG